MTDYTVNIGGVEYDVSAPDQETAVKEAHKFSQNELNTKAQAEYKDAPTWQKPFMAAQDVARTLADTATLGGVDKFADYMKPPIPGQPTQGEITKAIRSRMGGADIGADIGMTVAAAPTAVPKVVGMLGGGSIARAITGGATAATEGGVLGGLSAVGHDRPVGEGVAKGAVAGGAGQAAAGLLTKPANAVANWFTGANKALPPITDSQFKQASRAVGDDPATKAFSGVGSLLSSLSFPTAIAHGFLPGVAVKGASKAADFVANQGRREKVDNMRRLYSGDQKVQGPLTDSERLALGLRGRFARYPEE